MPNAINWFEIPVTDLDRAQAFYETVLARKLRRENFGGETLAVFPYDDPATGGALQAGANASARAGGGIRIYLDCRASMPCSRGSRRPAGRSWRPSPHCRPAWASSPICATPKATKSACIRWSRPP